MNAWDKMLNGIWNQTDPQTNSSVTLDDVLLRAMFNGEKLSREQVMAIPEVAADVDLISNTFALIPCKLYRREGDSVVEVENDPRVDLLNVDPRDTLDAFQFKKAMCTDYFVGANGGGYAYISRDRNNVKALHYVKSEDVTIWCNDDPIFKNYWIYVNAEKYEKTDFLKLLRNTRNGWDGESIISEVNDAMQAAYGLLKLQIALATKGGNKKGFLLSKKRLGKEEILALKNTWSSLYSNSSDNIPILNEGLDFKETSSSPMELQLNQCKTALNKEIDSIFHISDDREDFVRKAILPIGNAFETALNRDLLLEKEKKTYFWQLDYSELIKASMKERYEAYRSAKEAGWLMINEIREMENLEKVEGMDVLNVGLGAALYNTDDGTFYVPNTDTAKNREDKEENNEEP